MPLSSRAGGASRWRSFRGVGRPVGGVAIGVGVAIALCAAVGMVWDWLAWRR